MVRRIFGSVLDIRRGEIALALLMLLYYYLLLVTYYFLKPARDGLFLVKLGPEQLPVVYILIALIVVPVTTLYSRASRSLKLNQLINVTTVIFIGSLLILRWLLGIEQPWVLYVFYIWVSIYGVMATAQFWLLSNGVFDATQAKRIFVFFGLGGIVGAFTGGELTGAIVRTFDVSTKDLLLFCVAFLALCVLLVNAVWAIKQKGEAPIVHTTRTRTRDKTSYGEIFHDIKRSRHLMLIVGILAMGMATASLLDFQFKTIAAGIFDTEKDLTSFMGKFYGRLSLISFLFQFLVSYRFLKRFGVAGAILLLPAVLLGGTLFMLVAPGLLAGVVVRGADGVFRYSIDKTGRELLFLPVPLEVKKRTKVFIDMFVDRGFRGVAGLLLLLFFTVLHFSIRQLSIVIALFIGIWFVLVFVMRKEYVNAFRKALERREIDPGDLSMSIADPAVLGSLKNALQSANERQVVYAAQMLTGVQDDEITTALRPLLRHNSEEVRLVALKALQESTHNGDLVDEVGKLLNDTNPFVRREAMHYLCDNAPKEHDFTLKDYLQSQDIRIRSAAIGCIAEHGDPSQTGLVDEQVIRDVLASEGADGEFARTQLAEALGALGKSEYTSYLSQLLDDSSPAVVNQALLSTGRIRDRSFLPVLLDRLADKRYRKAARDGLAIFGEPIVGTLSDYIVDPSLSLTVRGNLCRVLSQIPSQHSVDALAAILDKAEPALKYFIIRALNSLRNGYPDFKFTHSALNDALLEESESYYAILQITRVLGGSSRPGCKLLDKALREKIDQNLERMFRILGLRYSQKDIYGAYLGIIGDQKQLRASAIEFLDNVLKQEVKRYLFPIFDTVTVEVKIRKGQELFGVNLSDHEASMKYILDGGDSWLRACAIFSLKGHLSPNLRSMIEKCRDDANPVVKETVRLVLES